MSLLIDGHNLIGALPSIELGARDDEQQLIVRLRAYHGFSGKTLIIFFDSGDAPGRADHLSTAGVQVHFARRPQTADDLIVAFLRQSAQPGQHAVVTNDRELAGRSRQLGASVISARDFARKLSPANRAAPEAAMADQTPSPRDPAFADLYSAFLAAEKDSARLSGQSAHGFAWWQEHLYGEDVTLAENAVHWLRRFAEPARALPLLLDALTHQQARVRAAAALALGQMAAPAAVERLAACLHHDGSSLVREAAAQALGQMPTPAALIALQAALHDPKHKVRKTAAAMLEKHKSNVRLKKITQ
ncbi:MAG: NYN domain-containing protein [Anaerolineae bacterium]